MRDRVGRNGARKVEPNSKMRGHLKNSKRRPTFELADFRKKSALSVAFSGGC